MPSRLKKKYLLNLLLLKVVKTKQRIKLDKIEFLFILKTLFF
jgi:hypothetical protein